MGLTPDALVARRAALPDLEKRRSELEGVASWLLINSMKSEKVQFELWCSHCAHNGWERKRAIQLLAQSHRGAAWPTASSGDAAESVAALDAMVGGEHGSSRAAHRQPVLVGGRPPPVLELKGLRVAPEGGLRLLLVGRLVTACFW